MSAARRGSKRIAALAAVGAAFALGACGDDETTTTAAGGEAWAIDAEAICAGASEETISLPLPGSAKQAAADARARAEVLTAARDELAALDVPADVEGELVGDYLAELDADIEQLEASGGRPGEQLDESAGQIASELGLDECAAFANAIARTP